MIIYDKDLFLTNLTSLDGKCEEEVEFEIEISTLYELIESGNWFDSDMVKDISIEAIEKAIEILEDYDHNSHHVANHVHFINDLICTQKCRDNIGNMKMKLTNNSINFF